MFSIQVEGCHQTQCQRVSRRVVDVLASVKAAVRGAAVRSGRESARTAAESRRYGRGDRGLVAEPARGRELRRAVLLVEQVLDAEGEVVPPMAVADGKIDLREPLGDQDAVVGRGR